MAREGKFKVYQGSAAPVYGFEVAAYDRQSPLVIDPVLSFSTYLGGTDWDEARAVALDSSGQAYITGTGRSTDFPITDDLTSGWTYEYAFITKLNAAGTAIVYSARPPLGAGEQPLEMPLPLMLPVRPMFPAPRYRTNIPSLLAALPTKRSRVLGVTPMPWWSMHRGTR